MPSRADLQRLLTASKEHHEALLADRIRLEKLIERSSRRIAEIEEEIAGTETIVTHGKQSGTVNSDMTEEHRTAISRGMRKLRKNRDAAFVKAYREAGFASQNAFAEFLGVSTASLSRYRNDRPCPPDVAEKVKRRTGFTGPWPAGVSSD